MFFASFDNCNDNICRKIQVRNRFSDPFVTVVQMNLNKMHIFFRAIFCFALDTGDRKSVV